MTRQLLAATLLALPGTAWACGGFFCNNNAPVEQTGEDVFFHIDQGTGLVTAHVQVQYQGPSEDFAWIVPVAEVPELGVGTQALFTQLTNTLTPQFTLQEVVEGDCKVPKDRSDDSGWTSTVTGSPSSSAGDYSGVHIVQTGEVGPYETVILQADSTDRLLGWLNTNGYDIPGALDPVLAPYVSAGQYFVALKLQKDKDTGDLAPLVMTYAGDMASIPIQLTSVAATPDMRLRVHVLGNGRAVPESYLALEINPFAIDWWSAGSNYDEVVTLAAKEAGGHGFATDFAGSASAIGQFASSRWDVDRLAAATDAVDFLDQVQYQSLPADEILLEILDAHVPIPEGADRIDVYNCPWCYEGELRALPFDAAAAAADVDALIVTPREDLDRIFENGGRISRLTSSLSPAKMTVDPVFILNRDLPDVDRERRATFTWECDKRHKIDEVPRRLSIDGYPDLRIPSERWMQENSIRSHRYILDLHEPSNALIEARAADGWGEVIRDNRKRIRQNIEAFNEEHANETRPGGGCGCSSSGPGSAGWVLIPLVLATIRRRDPTGL